MLLTTREVMAELKISRSSLHRLVQSGVFPKPVMVGPATVRFRREDLVAWVAQGGITSKAGNPMVASCWGPDQDDVAELLTDNIGDEDAE